ncbi:hypothetical protein LOD99_48 [Oopsacas minuta]|uniref:DAGKc domain-containing protein n=1 Tax=Oopsacas minuta TaxID=111878 RepID=A0AAV7K8Y1_9METZ|nr:hypothetical protein LOD99_48 [Oopsacas minuta]
MASKETISDPIPNNDNIEIIPTIDDDTLNKTICQNNDGIELGQVELLPGLEPATAYIYGIALVFTLGDKKRTTRSNSYHVKREKAKVASVNSKEIGFEEKANQPQCVIIKWEDFVNCRLREKGQKNENYELEIISFEVYALTKKMRYKRRRRCVLTFAVVPQSNESQIQANWIDKITLTGRKFVQKKFANTRELNDEELLAKKRVLILLNPVSGKRTGLKIFHAHVEQFLNDAGVEFELFVTQRANHARERLHDEDLDKWDGLLFMSGDGLLNEGVNGLLSREDATVAIQKPYGIIPCGSGNAIVGAILHYSHEDYSPLNAAFVFTKGLYSFCLHPMDVGLCIQGERKTYFCLVVNWGFSGDVDIESEVFRKIGEFRFILGAIWRVVDRRIYRADISYLPYDEIPDVAKGIGSGNENSIPGNVEPEVTISLPNNSGVENNLNSESPSPKPIEPSSWIDLPGPFTNVLLTLSPMLSHELFCAPSHKFGCGYFTLVNIPYTNVSRMQVLQMVDSFKEDNLANFVRLTFTKVKAFRFTPIYPPKGYIVVDGEVVPYETCSAEITGHKMFITSLFEKESQ